MKNSNRIIQIMLPFIMKPEMDYLILSKAKIIQYAILL